MPPICLILGDGVGQEVIPAAARVLAAVAPDLTFVEAEAGWECFQRHGTALPEATLDAVATAGGTLFGATQSPNEVVPGYRSPILALRRHFDLYANLRPTWAVLPGQPPVDLLLVRENTEGLYAGRERRDGDAAIAERVITRVASERIARVAFEQARRRVASHRAPPNPPTPNLPTPNLPIYQPTVTIVHKANVLKLTDGLFRETCLAVAKDYPDVAVSETLVDAAAMWLVKDPARFDVIVTTNLFGDILSDLAAGLVGGLGVAPSANLGAGQVAVFEPVHGSAPDIAGKGIANPIGAILSAAMLLDHIGRQDAADRVRQAVAAVMAAGILTPDLGGTASTELVTNAIIHHPSLAERMTAISNSFSLPPTGPDLLHSLLQIPSLSGQEAAASTFLAGWMAEHGLHAFVDAAGNAVGILDGGPAPEDRGPRDIVLLGHIDTVGGDVPVRIEDGKLYGRGAVDAKGPLAAFAAAVAQLQPQPGWRIVVVGAVEEEAATSKGARFAATQYRPAYCVIGEPSGSHRVTLGYKGRLLAHVTLRQGMAHSAGPDTSVCERAVDVWLRVRGRMAEINADQERVWDQVQPSLRSFHSGSDGLQDTAQMALGFRLPLDVGPEAVKAELLALAGDAELRFEGAEPAFRSDKNNALVRAFLVAIRSQGDQPGFVLKTGTSDMNVVGPIWRCPIVAYGPGDSALDHTPEEHVRIDEWQRGVAVLTQALHSLVTGL